MKHRGALVALVCALVVGGLLYWLFTPPLWIVKTPAGVEVHVENLGEYNSSLTALTMTDVTTNAIVVRLLPKDDLIEMWNLHLREGTNDLIPDLRITKDPGYVVETPANGDPVHLIKGHTYKVRVVGEPILHLIHLARTVSFVL
jgi:hypothetical protein